MQCSEVIKDKNFRMMIMRKKWNIKGHDAERAQELAKELGVSSFLAGIMLQRNIDTKEKAEVFLHPENQPYNDPMELPDMEKAVKRICAAIEAQEYIVVYGDYDADGITATSVMLHNLGRLGARVDYYIPDRFREGYGINLKALQKLQAEGCSLVITVDCGIKSVEEIAAMNEWMDFVITDHHLPGDELPNALAVVDAHRKDSTYPCPELAGVGIAFKLCQAVYQHLGKTSDDMGLELVALGTIADAVPLLDENRKIVAEGIARMKETSFCGLKALLSSAGIQSKNLNSTSVGFVLAPRINAAGRIEKASIAVDLLLADSDLVAEELAEKLSEINTERRALKEKIQKMAEEQLAKLDAVNSKVIVVAGQEWHHGVLGLVASSLQEKYYRPVVVISIKDGVGKGSSRSIEGFNLFEALSNCSDNLLQFGGHEMAAGLTVAEDKIDSLRQALQKEAERQLDYEDYIPYFDVDKELSPADLTMDMVEELQLLEPYGMKNEVPLFACTHVPVESPMLLGRDQTHMKFYVPGDAERVEVIAFNRSQDFGRVEKGRLDLVYEASINEWRDSRSVQCVLKSMDAPVMYQVHMPMDRDLMKELFIFLRNMAKRAQRITQDADWLNVGLRLHGVTMDKENLQQGLQVLEEMGLLSKKDADSYELNLHTGRLNLESSPLYCQLHQQ